MKRKRNQLVDHLRVNEVNWLQVSKITEQSIPERLDQPQVKIHNGRKKTQNGCQRETAQNLSPRVRDSRFTRFAGPEPKGNGTNRRRCMGSDRMARYWKQTRLCGENQRTKNQKTGSHWVHEEHMKLHSAERIRTARSNKAVF